MPTYEFTCPRGHEFEKFYSKISDSVSELPCPECGAVASRRISGGAGLLFKGSGFYLTDYGKNAHRGEKKSAEGGEPKSGDAKSGEVKSGEAKSGEATSGGGKSGEAKSREPASPGSSGAGASDGKSAGGTPAGGKPAAGKPDAPKRTSE